MTRAKLSFVAVVFGLLLSLVLYGCDGGDDSDFPNVRGVYRGTITETDSGCRNPQANGTFTANTTGNISSQNGADFSGTVVNASGNTTSSIAGQVTAGGGVSGTLTFSASGVASQSTFSGTLTGNALTVNYSGRVTAGETCVFQGRFIGTRQ